MTVVTVCSHFPTQDYYTHRAFFESCKKFGYLPIVLGRGNEYGGLGSKPRLLKQAIESGQVNDTNIIFCDAWDIVFQQTPALCEEWMHTHPNKIWWNAEKNCFPNPKFIDQFPETKTPFRYLNSGFSVGPTELYFQALKEMKAEEIPNDKQNEDGSWSTPNDQEYFQKAYLFGNVPMGLDTRAQLCHTLAGVEPSELDFSEPLIRNKESGSTPIAIHANGGQKEIWKPLILNHLNLPL
jgi:hypothetical protein